MKWQLYGLSSNNEDSIIKINMNLIIRNAKIIDSKSPFHNKTVDILIVDGLIKKIGTSLPSLEHTDEIQLIIYTYHKLV
jgi:hypothetical protein